jgi:hypothetical protein
MTESEIAVAQAELLDNVVATAQRLIRAEKDKTKITPTYIAAQVKRAVMVFSSDDSLSIDEDKAVSILIQRFSHWIGKAATLKNDLGHVEWLNSSRKSEWQYWRRYRDFQESKLSEKVVEGLDEATDSILALLEDPQRTDPWDRRGLVVGHVQSGKTSNYSGLICKAADAGYKIIIVLAGMHNNLRSQTQMRLEEGFLGYETTIDRNAGVPIGVAEFGENLKTNSATTRADNGDFNKTIAKHFHGIAPEERPWLFVVKKQKTVLTALLHWIQTRVADATDVESGRKLVTQLPLLMIDDEADNASVDTGEQLFTLDGTPDEEHQPKAINSLIRQLLHSFTRKAYVGYTATPFANIFIHHKGETAKEGPDLFPRSFIINLAAPSNYVGPALLFGRITKDGRVGGLPLTRDIEDTFDVQTETGWMPPKHDKSHVPIFNGQEIVPPSLREAIYSFVLACAVRELRGQGGKHSSMLIHVTRFVSVQNLVRQQVEDVVRRMRQRITRGVDSADLIAQMHQIWEKDFLPTRDEVAELSVQDEIPDLMPSWQQMLKVLPNVLDDIQVKSINGTAKDALDYATPGSAVKVIAIGGDKLARGLTLEGLCVSYFIRTTKMYDTLMQMGRWFGYRPGYIDLCRLYTSSDLVHWFGHIADASEELREEFDFMADANLTPEQYGLKVESHEVLTITSPLKMRSSKKLSLSYSGTRPQTILFYKTLKVQAANLAATDKLVSSLGVPQVAGPEYSRTGVADRWPRSSLWRDVPASSVLSFLNEYTTHAHATSAKSPVLAEFIEKMLAIGQLSKWSVALLAEGSGVGHPHTFSDQVTIDSYPMRTPDKSSDSDKFAIGVLTDPSDEGIDLDDETWSQALALTQNAWKSDPARGRVTMPIAPSGKGIRLARNKAGGGADRGLLLLYPLSPYQGKDLKEENLIVPGWNKPIMAFAIAFPSSETGIKVEYEVNQLYWMQEYGPSE